VLRLLVSGMAVGVINDHGCVGDWVEVTRPMISAMPESFSKDQGVEF